MTEREMSPTCPLQKGGPNLYYVQGVQGQVIITEYNVFPGIWLSYKDAHTLAFENLTGSHDLDVHLRYSLETQVTAQTPPAFLWHTWTDAAVPVENSLLFALALKSHGVQAEMHLFPFGEHGASLCNPQTSGTRSPHLNLPDCAQWPRMAADFLHRVLD